MLISIDKHIFWGATLLANKPIYVYLLCDSKIKREHQENKQITEAFWNKIQQTGDSFWVWLK